MKNKLLIFFIGAIFIGTVGFAFRYAQVQSKPVVATATVAATSTPAAWLSYNQAKTASYWADRIRAEGATAAYAEFASQAPSAITVAHDKAHAFGRALYATVGLPGITTCDSRFQYGCFHEFISDAIQDKGLSVVTKLDESCMTIKGPSGCQHGIGHGILEYEGYDVKGLNRALNDCTKLTKPYPFEGCYAGVFMEFNTRIMLGDNASPRELQNQDYIFPCTEIDGRYKNICAYFQPHWWSNVLSLKAAAADFARLGDLCRSLNLGADANQACFAGLGVWAGDDQQVYKDAQPAALLCDSAGTTPGEKLMCRSVAAGFLYSNNELPAASATCQGLSGAAFEFCQSYATGQTLFVYPKPLPK